MYRDDGGNGGRVTCPTRPAGRAGGDDAGRRGVRRRRRRAAGDDRRGGRPPRRRRGERRRRRRRAPAPPTSTRRRSATPSWTPTWPARRPAIPTPIRWQPPPPCSSRRSRPRRSPRRSWPTSWPRRSTLLQQAVDTKDGSLIGQADPGSGQRVGGRQLRVDEGRGDRRGLPLHRRPRHARRRVTTSST